MTTVDKILPQELKAESSYSVRLRSINRFGTASDWSEALKIDTSAAALANARRLVITNDGMLMYNSNGQIAFNYNGGAIAAIRTNLAKNPSFENNTVGFVGLTNSTISRTVVDYFVGETGKLAALQILASVAGTNVGVVHDISDVSRRISITAGLTYTTAVYVKLPTQSLLTSISVKVGLRFYDAGASLIEEKININANVITSTGWVRVSNVGVIAPAGSVYMGFVIYNTANMPINTYYYVDGILVEQTSILRDYFDGSSSAGTSVWLGTAHDSASTLDMSGTYSVNGGVFTQSTIQTSRTATTTGGVVMDSTGVKGYTASGGEAFVLSATDRRLTAGSVQVGTNILGTTDYTGINLDTSNGLYYNAWIRRGPTASIGPDTTYFRVGDATRYMIMDSYLSNYQIIFPNFTVNASGNITATNATISGAITATSGSFTGTITATSGTIGGFTIASTSLTAGSGSTAVGMNTTGFPFFAGNATPGSAPFRVSSAGAVNASNITITGGTISGSQIDIGSGATSFHVDTSGNVWLGATSYATSPFKISSAGTLSIGSISAGYPLVFNQEPTFGAGITSLGTIFLSSAGGCAVSIGVEFAVAAQGGFEIGRWPSNNAYYALWHHAGTANNYIVISNGTDTYVSCGTSGTTYVRGPMNSATAQLSVSSTVATFAAGCTAAVFDTVGIYTSTVNAGTYYLAQNHTTNAASGSSGYGFGAGGGTGGSIRWLNAGTTFHFVDYNSTTYYEIKASAFTVVSTIRVKQDVMTWPHQAQSVGAAVNTERVVDKLRRLRRVSFRQKSDQSLTQLPSGRRLEAYSRLRKYTEKRNLPEYKLPNHSCETDSCDGTKDDPCVRMKDWERGKLGWIAEEIAEEFPEIVSLDENKEIHGYQLDEMVAITQQSVMDIAEENDDLKKRLGILEMQMAELSKGV